MKKDITTNVVTTYSKDYENNVLVRVLKEDTTNKVTFGTIKKETAKRLNLGFAVVYAKEMMKASNYQIDIEINETTMQDFQIKVFPAHIKEGFEKVAISKNKEVSEFKELIEKELKKVENFKPLELATKFLTYYSDIQHTTFTTLNATLKKDFKNLFEWAKNNGGLQAMETDEVFHAMLKATANKYKDTYTFDDFNIAFCWFYNKMTGKKENKEIVKLAYSA